MSERDEQQAQRQERMYALIQRLTSKYKEEAAKAEAELLALPSKDLQELLTQFLALIRERKTFPYTAAVTIVIAAILAIAYSTIGAYLLAIVVCYSSLTQRFGELRAGSRAAMLIAQIDDVRVVGPLAEALLVADKNTQGFLGDNLMRLLPSLREGDLTSAQRMILCDVLLTEFSPALIVAILVALKKIGDSDAIPIVARLAEGGASAKHEATVRQAAQDCLRALEEKEAHIRRHETLVRAADPPTEHTLLRPAGSVGDTEPQQLLRAVSPSDQIPVYTNNPTVSGTEEEARLPLSN